MIFIACLMTDVMVNTVVLAWWKLSLSFPQMFPRIFDALHQVFLYIDIFCFTALLTVSLFLRTVAVRTDHGC